MDQNSLSNATNATDLKKIFEIISITLTFFGCFSNLVCIIVSISIVVFQRDKKRVSVFLSTLHKKRHGAYLFWISFFYFFTFLIRLIMQLIQLFNFEYGIIFFLILFGESISKIFSSWIWVALSLDTLYSIVTHRAELTKIYKILSPGYVMTIILLIIVPINVCIWLPFYNSEFNEDTFKNKTINNISKINKNTSESNFSTNRSYYQYHENHAEKIFFTISSIYIFLNSVIPFFIIGISTAVLIKKILKVKQESHVYQKKQKFVFRIILMNALFFIFNLPYYFSFIQSYYCGVNSKEKEVYFCRGKVLEFLNLLSHQFYYFFKTSWLFILLSTNKLFRKEFLKIFLKIFKCKKTQIS